MASTRPLALRTRHPSRRWRPSIRAHPTRAMTARLIAHSILAPKNGMSANGSRAPSMLRGRLSDPVARTTRAYRRRSPLCESGQRAISPASKTPGAGLQRLVHGNNAAVGGEASTFRPTRGVPHADPTTTSRVKGVATSITTRFCRHGRRLILQVERRRFLQCSERTNPPNAARE